MNTKKTDFKKAAYDIASVVIAVGMILAYFWIRNTTFYAVGSNGDILYFLLPFLVAAWEIAAGVRYLAFEKCKDVRKTKIRRNGIVFGLVVMVSVWFAPLVHAFKFRWIANILRAGFLLCGPLQSIVMLVLAIRWIVNVRREWQENEETAANASLRIVRTVMSVIALVVAVIAVCQGVIQGMFGMFLLLFGSP